MYWQANANTPLSVTPLLNVPYVFGRGQKPQRIFCGLFLPCKVVFRDPPKIPLKTSITLTFLRLCLPLQGYFALQGKR